MTFHPKTVSIEVNGESLPVIQIECVQPIAIASDFEFKLFVETRSDADRLLNKPAVLHLPEQKITGEIVMVQQTLSQSMRMKIRFCSVLHRLKYQRCTQGFVDCSAETIICSLLTGYRLDFSVSEIDPVFPFVLQHNETDFEFLVRFLREIAWVFICQPDGSIWVGDSLPEAKPILNLKLVDYYEVNELVPENIQIHSYNERNGLLKTQAHCEGGNGDIKYYRYFQDEEYGEQLVQRYKDAYSAKAQQFYLKTTCSALSPGNLIQTDEGDYRIVSVAHGLSARTQYYNEVMAVKSSQRVYLTPRMTSLDGLFNGKVKQNLSGGVYLIIPEFKISGQQKGIAMPLTQAYSDKKQGLRFQLEEGTEVVFSFLQNQSNRPFILGVLSDTPSVTHKNSEQHIIKSIGNMQCLFDDTQNQQKIVLGKPESQIKLADSAHIYSIKGKVNIHASSDLDIKGKTGINFQAKKSLSLSASKRFMVQSPSIRIQAATIKINTKKSSLQCERLTVKTQTAHLYSRSYTRLHADKNVTIRTRKGQVSAKKRLSLFSNTTLSIGQPSCGIKLLSDGTIILKGNIVNIVGQIIS